MTGAMPPPLVTRYPYLLLFLIIYFSYIIFIIIVKSIAATTIPLHRGTAREKDPEGPNRTLI
jgi:hypothetical protein